jgi:hypothetical protein
MADRNKFEEMLERLVNEDKAGAEELFHEIVVEKSRDIYANLIESDIEIEEEDKEVEEATDEEVDEATDEEVDESSDEEVDESSDEEVDENFDLDEFEVEGEPEMPGIGGDAGDDMIGDIEMGGDEEGEEGEEELEDRVVDLEDALDDLKAEFEKMMGDEGEEGDDDEEGEEAPEEEAFAFEATDEEVDEASDEEVDEATDEEVDEAVTPKSDREQMREYVDKVASGHGAEKKSTGDNGDSGKSPVASANNMGGTSANIVKGGEAGSGDHAGLGELNAKDQDGGNINVPGGKASKAGKSEPGHGAEKKGKPEQADKGAGSPLNGAPKRAK